ncbi:MAG TPA: hypothetical protein VN956_24710 [Pyrinomonadaceae bacterium]|nr:hypothetical protein [Pyrinomonadaceae bacterium]
MSRVIVRGLVEDRRKLLQRGLLRNRPAEEIVRAGSRPQEKIKHRAGVLQAQATLTNAESEYERAARLYREGVSSKAELDRALAQRDSARAP